MQRQQLIILFFRILFTPVFGQDITLYQQYNGHINYTAIGNTLNQFENNIDRSFCEILPSGRPLIHSDTADDTIMA